MTEFDRRQVLGGILGAGAAGLAATVKVNANAATGLPTPKTATRSIPVKIRLGSYTTNMDAYPSTLSDKATMIGAPITIASIFRGKGDTPYWPYNNDYTLGVKSGRILLVAWSLSDWGSYSWWASGAGDQILKDQAAKLKAYGGVVVLRPWAEMNADWVDFQPLPEGVTARTPNGGTPAEFKAAWQRVVTTIRNAGATNVKFCFNPTTDVYTGTTAINSIYPGDAYVDILGLDGYNWGGGNGFTWRSFDNVYRQQYTNLTALSTTKPVWVCETSSADPLSAGIGPVVTAPTGESKGKWFKDMGTSLKTYYPRVEAVCFFDANKERNWYVNSSDESLTGVKYFAANLPTVSKLTY